MNEGHIRNMENIFYVWKINKLKNNNFKKPFYAKLRYAFKVEINTIITDYLKKYILLLTIVIFYFIYIFIFIQPTRMHICGFPVYNLHKTLCDHFRYTWSISFFTLISLTQHFYNLKKKKSKHN